MNIKRMLLISRPIFWFLTGSFYLLGVYNFSNFSWLSILEFLFFLFTLNFYLYGLNDIYDIKSDQLNKRKGGIQGAILNKSEIVYLKKIIYILPLLFIILASFSMKLEHILLSLLFIIAAFIYSHPLFRFKEIPLLDTMTSAMVYTSPAFIAFSLHNSIFNIPKFYFLLILPLMGIHALTTLKDAAYDTKAGIKTIGVFLGKNLTILFMLLTFIIPFLFFLHNPYITIVLTIAIILGIILVVINDSDFKEMLFPSCVTLLILVVMSNLYFIVIANFYS